jgi:hypothetical protein
MKVLDILNPYKQLCEEEMLEESRLSTEFKIGFELEGICDSDEPGLSSSGILPSYHSGSEPTGGAKKLLDMLNAKLGLGDGKIERDGSLNTTGVNKTGHAWTFEYGSPTIPFTPKNMNKIYDFLSGLKDMGVYTNESCGFHTHISFKDIEKNDAKWLLFSIANDNRLMKMIKELETEEGDSIEFFDERYANSDWFNQLKVQGSFQDWSFYQSTSDKFLMMRMHPSHGTIEWRGPRNFINDGEKLNHIKGFIKKLWLLILEFGKIVDAKEYNGFKKEEVLKKMFVAGDFSSENEVKKEEKAKKLVSMIYTNPEILTLLSPSKLIKAIEQDDGILKTSYYRTDKTINDVWDRIQPSNKEVIIRHMLSKQIAIPMTNNQMFDVTTSKLVIKVSKNMSHEDLGSLFVIRVLPYIEFGSSEELKTIAEKWIKLSPIPVIKKMLSQEYLMNESLYNLLLKNVNISVLYSFKNIPTKIQMKMIRKNPYNIQYINNPSEKVVDMLRKQYGSTYEDYILGEI